MVIDMSLSSLVVICVTIVLVVSEIFKMEEE